MAKPRSEPMGKFSIYLPTALWDEIERIANAEDRPINRQLERFVRMGLEQYCQQHADDGRVRRIS